MTVTMFIMLVTICSIVSGFLTQGVKVWFANANKPYSANLLALINAAVVGCGGTILSYMLLSIPFNAANIAFCFSDTGFSSLANLVLS